MSNKAIILIGTALLLSACNTMAGMGQDISGAGKGLTNTSEKAKDNMTKPKNDTTGYYDDNDNFHYYK